MIRLFLGKVGSGKTASCVKEIVLNIDGKTTFSNIVMPKDIKHNIEINRSMIIKREIKGVTKSGKEIAEESFNDEFWKEANKKYNGMNVVLDEAHTLINSRRAMSKQNVIMNDFLALIRRILGDSSAEYGTLTLISQLGRRLDVTARELATEIHYHICHYIRYCKNCSFSYQECNEDLNKPRVCPRCYSKKLGKHSFVIEKWEFEDIDKFELWLNRRRKTYYNHYYIVDIEKYFPYYSTFQWENLISEY